ncbi:chromosome segregation protein SMC [Kordiimonas sp. SCSIO 12610]|uniref:chromosome segregation protein SMC n=1 Tax=Kordiimonas sp. SCSIO 12610 TaxID=2829597 RepID=UPI00210B4EF0|nr:chromosome segregation protein SMC [Kordiimonas sp. SCSIO 12610]UTW54498.1 chromosome segregation protein SMC [Kordiimonas sp. SCSIO 12610]
MRFSRLRLSGFKSFVDPTELLIEPGLTGVVGPNGCGKSNLLEALRWVMGENRAKSLRGAGMDDVIFAGTSKLSPRNFAEVTLVIDNVDRTAPAEFNDEEFIEVTRRIERESGSAYRINGKDVRQKDVQLLFADAATGAHSPALVSQGRIGSLINAKPQDRRAILEEAAGISGLHTRRKEAESRLRSAESNLVRVQDVIQAMDSQIASLKRQARQAIRYREVSNDIRKVEASALFLKWKTASDDVINQERLLREASKLVADAQVAVSKATTEQTEVAASIPAIREKDAEAAAKLQRITIQKDNMEAEAARRGEMAASLEAVIEQSEADHQRENEIAEDAKASLTRLDNEQERLRADKEGQQAAEQEAREKLEASVRAAGNAESAYDQLSEQAAQARAKRSSLESDRLAVARRSEQIESEKNRVQQEISSLEETDEIAAKVSQVQQEILQHENALKDAQAALVAAEAKVGELRTEFRTKESDHSAMNGRIKSLSSEVAGLERILTEGSKSDANPIADELKVEAGYERAVGAALGEDLEASMDHASDRYWSSEQAQNTEGTKWPEGVEAIGSFVTVPDILKNRFDHIGLIPDANKVDTVITNLSPGQRLVTKGGDVWRWDGFVSKANAPSRAAMRFEQKNRLEQLQADLTELQNEQGKLATLLEEAKSKLDFMRQSENEARQNRQNIERSLGEARRNLVAAEAEAAKKAGRLNTLRDSVLRLDNDLADTVRRLEEIDTKLSAIPEQTGFEGALQEKRVEVEELREVLSNARAAFDGLRREAQARDDRLRAISTEMGAWKLRVKSAEKQVKSLVERSLDAKKQLEALNARPEDTEADRIKLLDALKLAEEERRQTSETLVSAENTLKSKDKALNDLQIALNEVRERQIRGEGSVEAAVTRRKDIASLIGERFECAPTKLLEKAGVETSDSLPDIIVLEDKLEKLKRERDRLGAVNLRADEELNEIDEQRIHLVSEREDLEEAIARLRQAINGLNREGRERLLKAFDIVNQHFSELFTSLFGGGAAHLKLTESDDPLNAGLEIFASPPGKKLQSLSLLSGGEQALTALALIFAVFITNPAPICVLDEVDAPLDDANVERFCNLLDDMMERTDTRFLIVTHNAVSMSRMKRLFGVTMAERGISTLVSVDLERAEALRDAG